MNILQKEKTSLFEDLTNTLVKEANIKKFSGSEPYETTGWAREANIPVSSPLNTSEVLLGLLFARNVIIHGKLSNDVAKCIKGGIEFLTRNQCASGGWTTSESDVATASGNIVTTALAIWALNEYELQFDRDSVEINNLLEKAYKYVTKCQVNQDTHYKFRIASNNRKVMASAYALLSFVNLAIYKENVKNGENLFIGITDKIKNLIFLLNQSHEDGRFTFFEQAICFIALKQIKKYGILSENSGSFETLFKRVEKTLCELDSNKAITPYKDTRDVRENGTESDFCYFTPCWLLISLDYCNSTYVPYKKDLLTAISQTFNFSNDRFGIVYQGREWIWAIAQVLMCLSIHSSTQRLEEFLNIGATANKNSVFLVYGRNSKMKKAMENILNALSLSVITYDNSNANTRATYDAVKDGISRTALSIVLLTGDDEGRCRKAFRTQNDKNVIHEMRYTRQPRLNVVFEAGYSFAYRENKNVILITVDGVRLFSDLDGINKILIQTDRGNISSESNIKFKKELVKNLTNCGCDLAENAIDIISGIPLPNNLQ